MLSVSILLSLHLAPFSGGVSLDGGGMAARSSNVPPSILPHGQYHTNNITASTHHSHSPETNQRKGLLSQICQGRNSLALTESCDLPRANPCERGCSALIGRPEAQVHLGGSTSKTALDGGWSPSPRRCRRKGNSYGVGRYIWRMLRAPQTHELWYQAGVSPT